MVCRQTVLQWQTPPTVDGTVLYHTPFTGHNLDRPGAFLTKSHQHDELALEPRRYVFANDHEYVQAGLQAAASDGLYHLRAASRG